MEKDQRRAAEWFVEKGVDLKCTQCGGRTFNRGGVVALVAADPGEREQGRGLKAYPLACANCGYFVLFDAGTMGLDAESQSRPSPCEI